MIDSHITSVHLLLLLVVFLYQKYYWDPQHHSEVRSHWEEIHQNSIGDLVSKRRRSEEKKKKTRFHWPSRMEDDD